MVKTVKIILLLGLLILSLVIAADSMSKPIGHDEHMYCTAAALMAEGKVIYRDFSYIAQLPYHPTICAALYKLFNTTHFLLAGRLFSVVCDIIVILLISYIYCITLKNLPVVSKLLGLGAAALYIFNPVVDYANGFAWNHDMVILCVLLCFTLFMTTDFQNKSRYWRLALIGALLALATWSRMTTALIYIIFIIAIFKRLSGNLKHKIIDLIPFIASSVIISIWPLIILIMAPKAFILNVSIIPIFNGEWLREIAKIPGPSEVIFNSLTKPAYIILFILTIYFFVTIVLLRKKIQDIDYGNLMLSSIITVVFFIITFIPPAMFEQYFAMPALFIIISFTYPVLYLSRLNKQVLIKKQFHIACGVITTSVILTVLFNINILKRIPVLSEPQSWPAVELHKASKDIANKISEPKLILTLAPLYALEGGCEIYPEFSSGPFVYRIADAINEDARAAVIGASIHDLDRLTNEFPPSALILGTEPRGLEEPLYNAAVKSNWKRANYSNGIIVFFKP
ncbi:MAG: hypothetical protein ACYSSP_07100 [Planctomycetota bacterium]|jgi:hypothetical protein